LVQVVPLKLVILFPQLLAPLTWSATLTVLEVYPGWQAPHPAATCSDLPCLPVLGGIPWQEVQFIAVALAQFGAAPLPPVKLPWQ
jgi:hypothetical protein